MMVPIQVIRWYRMQCYGGTDSCATVVPIRRYCHVTINQSLNDLEQQLNPDLFFRVNRQYMVNIDSIDKLANFFKYKMTISLHGFPDLRIVVSKDRLTQLKNWLDR